MDGKHHLGDAVAARLGREAVDERAVGEAADDRHDEDDERAEEGKVRVGEVAERARVGVADEEQGPALDQVAEGDRAQPGADADQQREGDEQSVLAPEAPADPPDGAAWETGVGEC
jgi:hypothetical protein